MTSSPRASRGSPPPSHARDFGGLVHGAPARIAHPSSAREVSLAFRSARSDALPVAVRGAGHSQSGHTVLREGLVIDTSRLCGVRLHEGDILEVGGGQPWGGVIDALHGTGLTVPVLTDSAFPTVGGTLSAGGFGTASVRFGAQVGHVERLEVVTPAGDLVTCSRGAERELFDAVRAGQGQFGVITRAWLRLRRCPSRIRYYYLRYVDMDRLADDVERLYSDPRYGHLRLELRPHAGDALFRVGIEYEPPGPSPIELFLGLRCVEVQFGADADDIGRAGLLPDDLFPRQRFYPWRDWFLPWSALRRLLARPPVPPGRLPDAPGWGGCFFISSAHIDAPALVLPPGDRFFSYSVLPMFKRRADALEAHARLDAADGVIRDLGGCAYLSGATGYDASGWRAHFGEARHARLVRLQRAVDPGGLLRRPGLPFCA
ncbi:MAG: FAD-binding protein [Acidobacteria bacterium]|nr:FAD-binding protein [Acidobacteriota bacterium]